MISRSTFPAPTDGSWSISPTKIRRIPCGIAFKSAFIKTISIIEHSSTISTSPSSGFSSFLRYPSGGWHSRRRWIVFASRPVASVIRFAARPVGAASRILSPNARYAAMIPCVVVVFPVPGPPVSTITLETAALRIASAWTSSYSICTFSWIFSTSIDKSGLPVFSFAVSSAVHRRSAAGAASSLFNFPATPVSA